MAIVTPIVVPRITAIMLKSVYSAKIMGGGNIQIIFMLFYNFHLQKFLKEDREVRVVFRHAQFPSYLTAVLVQTAETCVVPCPYEEGRQAPPPFRS